MKVKIANTLFGICKHGSVLSMNLKKTIFDYRGDITNLLVEQHALHRAGFETVNDGSILTVMSPAT